MNSFLFHPFIDDDNDEKVVGPNHLRAYRTFFLCLFFSSFFLFQYGRSFLFYAKTHRYTHTHTYSCNFETDHYLHASRAFILVLWLFFLFISIDECLLVSWCAHISVRDHLVVNKKTKAIKVARKHRAARVQEREREGGGEITKKR